MSAEPDSVIRLPWTGEFTPGQLGENALEETLSIVDANPGHRDAIVEAIRMRWFTEAASFRTDPAARLKQQRTRSGNVLNGMQRYGLVDETYRLTGLGNELLAISDPARRASVFAEFLLKQRRGLELLDIVRDLQRRNEPVSKLGLNNELRKRGYQVANGNADAGKLRAWLGTAGLVSSKWEIDETRLAEVCGFTTGTLADWQLLTNVQQGFLRSLRRLSETRGTLPIASGEFLEFVRDEQGPIFDESQVGKIYTALEEKGWIQHQVKSAGRGGKGGKIAATKKLIDIDFEALVGFRPGDLPADLRSVLTTPLDEIYSDLQSPSTHTKGIALELLAVNLANDLGLQPLKLRVRGTTTGGAEVDLVAEGSHLHFSRWLFQCKNTKSVGVGVLAKEVGMATLLQAQVIVIATTGSVSKSVLTYAQRVSETTQFQVVIADGTLLNEYRSGGASTLRRRFRENAQTAMRLKRPQVLETLGDLGEDDGQ